MSYLWIYQYHTPDLSKLSSFCLLSSYMFNCNIMTQGLQLLPLFRRDGVEKLHLEINHNIKALITIYHNSITVTLASWELNKHASVGADSGSNPKQPVKGETRKHMLSHSGEKAGYSARAGLPNYLQCKLLGHLVLSKPGKNDSNVVAVKGTESSREKRERSERLQRGLLCVDTRSTQVVSICSLS